MKSYKNERFVLHFYETIKELYSYVPELLKLYMVSDISYYMEELQMMHQLYKDLFVLLPTTF